MASTGITLSLFSMNPNFPHKSKRTLFFSPSPPPTRSPEFRHVKRKPSRYETFVGTLGAGLALTVVGPASAAGLPLLGQLSEHANALSLPTWAIHVSSVVEWITAMALAWQYGEKTGFESWKGLSWGMVLVALQAALTVIGNATMCIAAFRICKSSSEERPQESLSFQVLHLNE